NRDLPQMVEEGKFRADLLYRIKVAHLHIPPLRERQEDIPALIEHALRRAGASSVIAPEAMAILQRYPWPGNVRELQNVIEQAISFAGGETITIDDLPPALVTTARGAKAPSRERR